MYMTLAWRGGDVSKIGQISRARTADRRAAGAGHGSRAQRGAQGLRSLLAHAEACNSGLNQSEDCWKERGNRDGGQASC
jgi:hypothetical protein